MKTKTTKEWILCNTIFGFLGEKPEHNWEFFKDELKARRFKIKKDAIDIINESNSICQPYPGDWIIIRVKVDTTIEMLLSQEKYYGRPF